MSEIQCPHCKNPIYDEDALLCHFCGNSLNRASQGALGSMRSAGGKWLWITLAILAALAFLLTFVHF
ncbi:MAG: hypothetical protein HGA80_09585, partial [Candidatus Omnitrophica bacterium]|nr:hypothetical protein [Candidatus Omnitrophota bacterium]